MEERLLITASSADETTSTDSDAEIELTDSEGEIQFADSDNPRQNNPSLHSASSGAAINQVPPCNWASGIINNNIIIIDTPGSVCEYSYNILFGLSLYTHSDTI